MEYVYHYLACLLVIFFVGLSLKAKPWVSLLGGAGGAVGYLVYLLCANQQLGFLCGTLVLAFLSELFARICKMPSSIFMILGIYPLVPGIALYQTVAYAFRGEYLKALEQGGDALVSIALMAVAIAFATVVFRIMNRAGKEKKDTLQ